MKLAFATAVVIAAAEVSAQGYSSPSSSSVTAAPSTEYSYSYYDDCYTEPTGESTETDTIVSTYCSVCEESSSASAASAFSAAGGVITTYTTVYSQFCPSSSGFFEEKTYTVTESCSSSVHGQPRPSGYVPQGFTVTTTTCHVCGPKPVVATITTPVPSPTAPAPAPAAPTGGSPSGGSSPAAPAGGSAPSGSSPEGSSPGGSSPGGSSPEGSPGTAPSAEASPAPYATPESYAAAPTGAVGPAGYGNSSTPITPFTGSASSMSVGLAVMGFAGVGALAFLL